MKFDAFTYRYPSRRGLVYGTRGMVATSQPLAAQAGLDALKKGGNAIDAAVAAAACMTVVEPTTNGLGSDMFAIIWKDGKLYGLNASGKAPKALSAELVRSLGYEKMPQRGWLPVMVHGAVAGWATLSERFGKLSFEELLQPAAGYAEQGFAVTPVIADLWERGYKLFANREGDEFRPWAETFAPKGHAPRPGEIWSCPEMAETIRMIAQTKGRVMYEGSLADAIDAFSRKTGGFIRKEDLEGYQPQWVDPIKVNYRGTDVWEMPPNGDGLVVLAALAVLNNIELDREHPDSPENFHKLIEAMKLGYEDGLKYISDPRTMKVPAEAIIAPEYAKKRAALIGEEAIHPFPGEPTAGSTIYLCTADAEGNMVSLIQSNFNGFGSGIVVPGTGISLQNRGFGFSLDPESPNVLAPGKKSFHTIIPGFLTKDGKALGPFGVMGAFMQPQGQLQVAVNMIDFGMNPQEALDRPRWEWVKDKKIVLEESVPEEIAEALRARGHEVGREPDTSVFGRGQIILRNEEGVLTGATEPRADGTVAVW